MDVSTLAIANEMVLSANAAVLYLCAARKQPGIRWFAHACGLAVVGRALLALGPQSGMTPVLLGFAGVSAAMMLLRWGLEDLIGGESRRWRRDALVLAAQSLGMAYFIWVRPQIGPAYLAGSLGQAAETALALGPLWGAAGQRLTARLTALYVLSSYTAFTLVRAVAFAAVRRPAQIHGLVVVTISGEMVYNSLFAMGSLWLALNAQQERLSEQTRRDPLTSVLNYRGLRSVLVTAMADPRLRREPLAVVAIDLDHFKHVNDVYGHAAGDAALVALARILKSAVRAGDAVGRCGGEEFVLVLPGKGASAALATAERLRAEIANAGFQFEGVPISMAASFGIALTDPAADARGEEAVSEILRRADRALYAAKNAGRNCTVLDGALPHAAPAQAAASR